MDIKIAELRRKALVTFLQEHFLYVTYARSKYKTPYGFIKYNYKSKFYKWVLTTEFKDLFINDKGREE